MACNCSICERKGSLLWFVPHDQLPPPHAGREREHVHVQQAHVIEHRFCPNCGMHPYGEGTDPKGGRMAAVNIRCLEGIDLAAIPVTDFDGR